MNAAQGLLALAPASTWSIGEWLIAALIVGGVIAVFYVIWTKALGWTFPAWLPQVFWILVGVVVGIVAIRFLLSL